MAGKRKTTTKKNVGEKDLTDDDVRMRSIKNKASMTSEKIFIKISEISIKYDWIQLEEDMREHLSVQADNPLDVATKLANAPLMKNLMGQARIEFESMLIQMKIEYDYWLAKKIGEEFDLSKKGGTAKEREITVKEKSKAEFERKFGAMEELSKYIKQLELAEECFRYLERSLNGIAGMMRGTLTHLGYEP